MKKRVIAVDFDDVVVETGPLIVKHYNETYGTKVPLTALYSQDVSLWGADSLQTVLRRIDAFEMSEDYLTQTRLLSNPYTLRSLARSHELHIVTGRPSHMQTVTASAIRLYVPDIFHEVHYTGIFGKNPRTKSDVCLAIGADLLIDDHIAHAHDVTRFGIDVLLFGDYPWNRHDDIPPRTRRVRDWDEVAQYLETAKVAA